MEKINLAEKTKVQKGTGEIYWFENKSIGLEKTLYHRFYIPLLPFDSGLDYEDQPVTTQIVFDWFEFNLEDVGNLEKVNWDLIGNNFGVEVSIYLGSAHNPCDIKDLRFKRIEENVFEMKCDLYIDFEHENVAENEHFNFVTQIKLNPTVKI